MIVKADDVFVLVSAALVMLMYDTWGCYFLRGNGFKQKCES